jgi:hypothetical protein
VLAIVSASLTTDRKSVTTKVKNVEMSLIVSRECRAMHNNKTEPGSREEEVREGCGGCSIRTLGVA